MKKIVIDAGHGGTDSGASYQGNLEKNFNLSIALKVQSHLQQNYEAEIVMTRTSDVTLSLDARSRLANNENADFFLSIHNNAAGGQGFESYIFNGTVSAPTRTYQNAIHDRIMSAVQSKYNIRDRGKKRANFHVLRETRMPALLLEVLFVDNASDVAKLRNPAFIEEVSIAIAQGTAEALNLPRKAQPDTLYRVIAGSFKSRDNAEQRVQELSRRNIDSFIRTASISGETYYRVQAGAFSERARAEEQVERLKNAGISDAFIITDNEESDPVPPATPEERFTIEGSTHMLAHQLDEFARTVNPKAPKLGAHYVRYGKAYGIRADVAFAQAIHETDYFRFTGVVDADQNNYAGIGATGPDNKGSRFATPRDGVHAHIQHLYAYSSTEDIPEQFEKIDPRFDLVTRGIAPTWTQLNGRWAVPGTTYGQSIINIFKRNITHAIEQIDKKKQELENVLDEF
ncbi:N-acetylmuramoyl-L-alanine amidase [Halobacillus sp. A5]|uniref:N-acetylmuramoyl-L-alanine amidase n=1 Tax=Halobacillus sp. A5 TaxID=2880263 RepID=UPI0020A650B8|nr:N-acetylmuramoyl-L-alanine amidase [Halobacillus sp. A5]MCP3026537.1 N-acetylmuramoyl-L-alanine amidase [Halobacillus sp. A5]